MSERMNDAARKWEAEQPHVVAWANAYGDDWLSDERRYRDRDEQEEAWERAGAACADVRALEAALRLGSSDATPLLLGDEAFGEYLLAAAAAGVIIQPELHERRRVHKLVEATRADVSDRLQRVIELLDAEVAA
jgi:hypothetical protein